jgi:hypothetical protein
MTDVETPVLDMLVRRLGQVRAHALRGGSSGGTRWRDLLSLAVRAARVSGLIGLGRMGSGFGDGVGLGPPGWG